MTENQLDFFERFCFAFGEKTPDTDGTGSVAFYKNERRIVLRFFSPFTWLMTFTAKDGEKYTLEEIATFHFEDEIEEGFSVIVFGDQGKCGREIVEIAYKLGGFNDLSQHFELEIDTGYFATAHQKMEWKKQMKKMRENENH